MLKLTGAVCVLSGAILIWLVNMRERARRREILSDLSTGFFRLADEIRATRKPLAVLFARLASDSESDAAIFFHAVSDAANYVNLNFAPEDLRDRNFASIWREAAEGLCLEARDKKRLAEISGDLRGDETRIRKALAAAGGYFAKRLAESDESARDDNRRMAALALSGGTLLVILLY